MNQQQIINEILSFPISVQYEIMNKIRQNLRSETENSTDLSVDERLKIVKKLAGIAAFKNEPAPTDEEIKEDYANYLSEKYK